MAKFANALKITVIDKDRTISIIEQLEQIGYTTLDYRSRELNDKYLVTNGYNINGKLLNISTTDPETDKERIQLDDSNPELIIALASMMDDDKAHRGEWFVYIRDINSNNFTSGKLYQKVNDGIESPFGFVNDNGKEDGYCGDNHKYFRKATAIEIITYFNLKKMNNIIGYKCPQGYYEGVVPAGTLYVKSDKGRFYEPQGCNHAAVLPKEIVETWEPVYEQKFEIGDWVISDTACEPTPVLISSINEDGGYEIGGSSFISKSRAYLFRKATKQEIESVNRIEIGGYVSEYRDGYVTFGCKVINKQTLIDLMEVAKDTNITIGGTNVTLEMLGKLLSKL